MSRSVPVNDRKPQAIILAAGQGTRMGGDLPKVVFEVADEPMVRWVVRACRQAGVQRCIIVVGYKADMVRDALAEEPDCVFVEQRRQLGTGHATQMAQALFAGAMPGEPGEPGEPGGPGEPGEPGASATDVFILAGDGPLIRAQTLRHLLQAHRQSGAAATLATAVLNNPEGYGRVVRDAEGRFQAIVEQKDATPEQLAIREVNPSYYCFRSDELFAALGRVRNDNAQGEYYLTDVPGLLKREGKVVSVVDAVPAQDVLSINTPQQLAQVDAVLRARLAKTKDQPPGYPGSPGSPGFPGSPGSPGSSDSQPACAKDGA